MPTPSETARPAEWAARTQAPRRSVFSNYSSPESTGLPEEGDRSSADGIPATATPHAPSTGAGELNRLQTPIARAVASTYV